MINGSTTAAVKSIQRIKPISIQQRRRLVLISKSKRRVERNENEMMGLILRRIRVCRWNLVEICLNMVSRLLGRLHWDYSCRSLWWHVDARNGFVLI